MNSQEKWDNHFLQLCLAHSKMSKDPSTKVGSIIIGPDKEVRSVGFNGFPRMIEDTHERLNDKNLKLKLIVHAELNAILAAARIGIPLKGCTLYVYAQKLGEKPWGAPCTRCAVELIQAGITEVIAFNRLELPETWKEDCLFAEQLIKEAGINYRDITYERL